MRATMRQVLSAAAGAATLAGWLGHAGAAGSPGEGAASAQTVKLPAGPGSVRGLADDPTVDEFTGQASYRVPLELPKAARGFAPAVDLAYHGELGNGPLGIGWQVGVPMIRRSTHKGVPSFTSNDVLELVGVAGGGRMVKIATGEYRLEGQGNLVKIVEVSGGFEVRGPDGTRYRLGVSAASRQDFGTRVSAWMAEQVVDVAGQSVGYTYVKNQGQIYLSRIAYGPGGKYAVVFELGDRADKVTSWRSGFKVTTAQRVNAIRIEAYDPVAGAVAIQRRYVLAYDETFTLSRLKGVRVLGRGGIDTPDNALPALSFGYAERGAAETQQLAVDDWRLGDTTVLADVDGDGAADLVQIKNGSHKYRQNRGGSFGPEIAITGASSLTLVGNDGARLADVEGKNVPNLIARTSNQWAPYRINIVPPATPGGTPTASWATWSTWSAVTTLNVPYRGPSVVLADINGDARMDALTWSGSAVQVRYGNGNGLSSASSVGLIAGSLTPDANMRWVDVNGDGLSDIIYLRTDGKMRVYLGHGDGTFETDKDLPYPSGSDSTSDLRFADLNRDGLLDLVLVTQAEARWYLGKADGSFAAAPVILAKPAGAATSSLVSIQDANGNGSEDVVWSSTGPTGGMWALDLAGPTNAGMLVSVDNGLGKRLDIHYAATTKLAGDAADAGNPWLSFLPIAIPVVTRTEVTTGPGQLARVIEFLVRDGFWDSAEHRFGGFKSSRKIVRGGAAGDLVTDTAYHTGTSVNRVLRGKPTRVTTQIVVDGVSTLISVTTNTWLAKRVTSLPADDLLRKAVLSQVSTEHHEGRPAGSPLVTRSTSSFDGEGREILVVDEGRVDLPGDDRRIERSFADDATRWVRDLVAEEKISGPGGALVSHTRTFYGDETGELALGQAGKGWKRRTQAFLADENRWIDQGVWQLDALGNVIASRDNGVRREIDYDESGLFAIEERLYTSETAFLAWRFTWDEVLGAPLSMTGPDGVTAHTAYDGLARPIQQSRGDARPHAFYRYAWNGAYPENETFTYDGPADAVPERPEAWTADSRWRHDIVVADGEGTVLHKLTQLDADRFLVSDWVELDARGRVVFRGDAAETDSATLSLSRPAGMVGQELAYDPLDREIRKQLADGSTRTTSHAAFRAITASAGLADVTIEKDGRERVIENRRADELTRVSYDAAGRVTGYQVFRAGEAAAAAFQDYSYDSLGRLVATAGSDGDERTMSYDDGGRLLTVENAAGQSIANSYDGAGRLLARVLDDGTAFTYHYDAACTGETGTYLAGRLACVDEPTGRASFSYDDLGNRIAERRTVDGLEAEKRTRFSPSGLPLHTGFDDALELDIRYDAAGRPLAIGDLWTREAADPAGRVLAERYGNGVVQTYERDAIGAPTRIDVAREDGSKLYGIDVTREAWGAVATIVDDDGHGLDHSATFTYDSRGRLIRAMMGSGTQVHDLGYSFDELQNLTGRTVVGPSVPGLLAGSYRYGEGAGPRQLTSIVDGDGSVLHTFSYDAAGRQLSADGRTMAWNALDQLIAVSGDATVAHAYGHDGRRVRSVGPGGEKRWLGEGIAQVGNIREYHVILGERVLARVRVQLDAPAAGGGLSAGVLRGAWLALLAAIGVVLVLLGRGTRRPTWARATASAGVLAFLHACAGGGPVQSDRRAFAGTTEVVYFHQGISPGPVLFTGAGGAVVDERRYEPFGQPLAEVDYASLDWNSLNKQSDPATGWSDHGARWFAPETARWQSLDPPTLTGDAKYALEPWSLHPYQYTDSNPIKYWDPDGRDKVDVGTRQQKPAAVTTIAPSESITAEPYTPAYNFFGFKIWAPPTAAQMVQHPTVVAAMKKSWEDSFNADGTIKGEQGGFLYYNPYTGDIKVHYVSSTDNDSIEMWNPPVIKGYYPMGTYHTHPNPSPAYAPEPSGGDLTVNTYVNVPEFVISEVGVYHYGATRYGETGTVDFRAPSDR